ncbi:hypothetical protein FOCC_FOCC012653 [Frankliniella occidentalis]|nr:hypothetical protein FOCC_FOCC012653 [Frankliniella occidentalis]
MDASSEDEHNSVRSSSPYRSPVSSPGVASSPPDPASSPPYIPNSSPSRDANYSPPTQQYPSKRKDYEIFEPGVPSSSKRLRREERSDSNDSLGNVHESNGNIEFGHDADAFSDGSDMASQGAAEGSVFTEADQENDNPEENIPEQNNCEMIAQENDGAEDIVLTESSSEDFSSSGSSSADSDVQSSSSEDENESLASSSESDNPSDSEQCEDSDSDSDVDVVSPPVYEGSTLTVDEGVLEMMNLYLKHSMEKTAIGDTLKSTLNFLPRLNNMPKSQYSLLKYVSSLCPLGRKKVPLADQIKNFFENHGLADEIDKYAAERQAAGIDGLYSDLCDGSVIKNVKTPGGYNLTLVGHTDGLSISKSSNVSVWPLKFVIAELPPHLRYKYVLVCGIWIDETKPNLNSYLRPFVTEISLLNENGGVKWVHPKTKLQHSTTVTVPIFIADAPARAQLQNILAPGGKHCCNVCEQKMKKLPAEPLRLGVKRKNTVSDVDINKATVMLQTFCRDFSRLYKADFFTYYVHNILHLPLAVQRNGPLWCHSAFQFESFNGILVKFIHSSHHQAQELVNNIRLAFGVAALEGRVKKNNISKSKTIEFKNRVISCRFTNAEEALFTLEFGEAACKIKVFYRAKVGNEVYTTTIYKRQKKRNNYTICYFNRSTQKEAWRDKVHL